jgi:hypothetical protein
MLVKTVPPSHLLVVKTIIDTNVINVISVSNPGQSMLAMALVLVVMMLMPIHDQNVQNVSDTVQSLFDESFPRLDVRHGHCIVPCVRAVQWPFSNI